MTRARGVEHRLGRGMWVNFDRALHRLCLDERGRVDRRLMTRPEVFSRVRGDDDYAQVERLPIVHPDTFITAYTGSERLRVYAFSESGWAEEVGTAVDRNVQRVFMDAHRLCAATDVLAGSAAAWLGDQRFNVGDDVDVRAVDGDTEYVLTNTNYFNLRHRYLLPRLVDGQLAAVPWGHERCLYRTTVDYRNGYPAFPKGTLFVVHNLDADTYTLYDGSYRDFDDQFVAASDDLDDLLNGTMHDRLLVSARRLLRTRLVSLDTCQLFVSVRS